MTTFPLAPAVCDSPDLGGVVPAICLPEATGPAPTLAEVVGNDQGHLLGGSGLDAAFAHAAQAPAAPSGSLEALGHVPAGWWVGLTPGGTVALVTITVVCILLAGLIGWGIYTARGAR